VSPQKEKKVNNKEQQKLDCTKVQQGHIMAFVYWAYINSKSGDSRLNVTDLDTGLSFIVDGTSLIEKSFSADIYERTEKVTKTEMAERLVTAFNRPFTVEFKKADGSIRKLRGRLVQPEPLLGRSLCEDLDLLSTERLRLVDHREIQSLVVDNVTYLLK
jgi:hypothetical protein